jgi:hypothetical protein
MLWVINLIGEVRVLFNYILGRGFLMLEIDELNTIKRILMLTPLKSSWGMCIFQSWVASFNPNNPKGMQLPT